MMTAQRAKAFGIRHVYGRSLRGRGHRVITRALHITFTVVRRTIKNLVRIPRDLIASHVSSLFSFCPSFVYCCNSRL